jgi:hypothetical protein
LLSLEEKNDPRARLITEWENLSMTNSTLQTRNDSTASNGDATSWASLQLAECTSASLAVSSLTLGETPRSVETHIEHVRALADVAGTLPPILVHGPSRRVIDGVHRVRAAMLCGEQTIRARIYSGSLDDAFVLAVNLNAKHGLTLSRPERMNAAERILRSHGQWSDRMIAGITGLSAGTIRKLRQGSAESAAQPATRVGRDGRSRPVNSAAGRERARQLLVESPTAPVRAVAREAGVSAATVLDVRRRLAAGEDAIPQRLRNGGSLNNEIPVKEICQTPDLSEPKAPDVDVPAMLARLSNDPSIRLNGLGRFLLRWMMMSQHGMDASWQIIDAVPDHCVGTVATLARNYSARWAELATELDRATHESGDQG